MNGCKIIRSENVWSLLSCATSKTVWAEVNMLTGDKAECGHFQLRFIYVLMRWENDADDGHDVCWWSGLLQAVPVMTVSVVPACLRPSCCCCCLWYTAVKIHSRVMWLLSSVTFYYGNAADLTDYSYNVGECAVCKLRAELHLLIIWTQHCPVNSCDCRW